MAKAMHWSKAIVVLAFLVAGAGACKGKPSGGTSSSAPSAAPSSSKLTDLSTSLDSIRASFNAHKQEARFLTLLSPA
jgi:hypothetical protein